MSLTLFYRQQADEQKRAAHGSVLQNVREHWRRASDAWTELAERSERNETARNQAAADKHPTEAGI